MKILLLRHGQTEANVKRQYCGWSDPGLNADGRARLEHLRDTARYPEAARFAAITSGMRRTDETLKILFSREPEKREIRFREMNFGAFELKTHTELEKNPSYIRWIMDRDGLIPASGGECERDFKERVFQAFDELNEDTLVICHGGVIAALMQRLFPEAHQNRFEWQPDFGCGYLLENKGDGMQWIAIPKVK